MAALLTRIRAEAGTLIYLKTSSAPTQWAVKAIKRSRGSHARYLGRGMSSGVATSMLSKWRNSRFGAFVRSVKRSMSLITARLSSRSNERNRWVSRGNRFPGTQLEIPVSARALRDDSALPKSTFVSFGFAKLTFRRTSWVPIFGPCSTRTLATVRRGALTVKIQAGGSQREW